MKNDNSVRVITSGCNTAIEKLSILVQKTLYPIADNLPSKFKDINNILEIIDQLNEFVLTDNFVLVSFDAVNMFLNIENRSGLESIKFNDQNFLQTDGTAQGPHMSCSYAEIAMVKYDALANDVYLKPKIWKGFRDEIFTLWEHGINTLPSFLDYLNGMDTTGKIKVTMEITDENGLGFSDLKLKITEGKTRVDVYEKPTNSFSYTSPNTCYPKNTIWNIPKSIALRLRCISDDDKTFDKHSTEYQNYLIAREHKSSLFKQQLSEVRKKTRTEAWKKQNRKENISDVKFITAYNRALPNINRIIKNNQSILHTDDKMKKIFLPNTIETLYTHEKILRKSYHLLCFLLRLSKFKIILLVVTNVIFVSDTKFKYKVTGRVYNIRGKLTCNSPNVVYLISRSNCDDQYVESDLDFKSRFRIQKSDIKTKKDRCGCQAFQQQMY